MKNTDKVNIEKSSERRFLFDIEVSSTFWNRIAMRKTNDFKLRKFRFLNKLSSLVSKRKKKLI